MKKIRAKQNVVINSMTVSAGQEIPVFDEKILESPEVKQLLQEGKIEIINDEKIDGWM